MRPACRFPYVQDALLKIDLTWAQELCIYMFVWMAKFGAAYGVRTGIHVGVDVMINRLPGNTRKAYVLFGLLAGATFTAIVGTLGATFVWDIAHTDSVSPDLELPKWIAYLCIPLGSYLMCFRFLQVAWSFARTGELPHHDVAHVEGIEAVEDINPYALPDNLHPADVGGPQMSTLVSPVPADAPRWPALIPPVMIAIPVVLKLAGVPIANAWIIFALLFGLMLTGMPISISLGLTVLTYLFTMTTVPIESVALKLFTGIEKFEIMAIPFFILAGNFLTHGGVARRMIAFASSMVGHWAGGLGLAGVMACALFAAVSGSSPATVVAIGSIILPAMVRQGFPPRFGAGVITTSGRARHPDPPVDRDGDVRGRDQHVGRRAVHRRDRPRHRAGDVSGHDDVVAGAQEQLPAAAQGERGRNAGRPSARASGGSCS